MIIYKMNWVSGFIIIITGALVRISESIQININFIELKLDSLFKLSQY